MDTLTKCETGKARAAERFYCQECGHGFRTVKAAERASSSDEGCPKCGGADIDLGKPVPPPEKGSGMSRAASARLAEVVTALDAARECLDGARYDDATAGQFRTLTEARDLVQQARRLVEGALLEGAK